MVKNVVADSPVYAGMDSTSAPINPILSRVGIARATTTLKKKKKKKKINNSRNTHKENILEQFDGWRLERRFAHTLGGGSSRFLRIVLRTDGWDRRYLRYPKIQSD
jgi:hypothetical protein